jgi:RNA polymerase sigma factor (sigma-70 family)
VAIYEPLVYRLLRRHGLQDADAREVMQELLLAVSRSIERWNPDRERGTFRGWLRRVSRNLVINWLKHRDRKLLISGDAELQVLLDRLPAAAEAETNVFDQELRRALFHRAAEQVRGELQSQTWDAFWETAVLGTASKCAAKKLGMTVGAVRVAKCRVLARLQAKVKELENEP